MITQNKYETSTSKEKIMKSVKKKGKFQVE